MTAPPRVPATKRNAAPSPAIDTTTEVTADLAKSRPALMDRLHYARADASQVQQTIGNRMAQRLAQERRNTGDAPIDGSAPKLDEDARTKGRALQPQADEPTAPPIAAPDTPALAQASDSHGKTPDVAAPPPAPAMGVSAVKPPAPGPAHTINDLQSQVARAADAIPKPTGGGYTAAQQAIRAQGFRLAS